VHDVTEEREDGSVEVIEERRSEDCSEMNAGEGKGKITLRRIG